MAESRIETIALADLLLDPKNVRHDVLEKQRDILQAMLVGPDASGFLVLALNILENGTNPADLPIVTPFGKSGSKYLVNEGNRRVSALKVLENNKLLQLAVGLPKAQLQQWKQACEKYSRQDRVTSLRCVIFESREGALPWTDLMHTGENNGAGRVSWGPAEAARFAERFLDRKPKPLALLEYVQSKSPSAAGISAKKKKFPYTSFTRLTPQMCTQWGIRYEDGLIRIKPEDEDRAVKGVTRIMEDLSGAGGRERKKVGSIMSQQNRVNYVRDVDFAVAGGPTGPHRVPHDGPGKSQTTAQDAAKKHRAGSGRFMFPEDCTLAIPQPRIRALCEELQQRVEVKRAPNAVAVVFRVFLELSVEAFIDKHKVVVKTKAQNPKDASLHEKLKGAMAYMKENGLLTDNQLKPMHVEMKDKHSLVHPNTLNAYVHNPDFEPKARDLFETWMRSALFVEALWREPQP